MWCKEKLVRTSCWGEKYDHFPLKLSAAAAHFEAIRLSLLSLHTNKDPFSAWVLFSRVVEVPGIQGGARDAQAPHPIFAIIWQLQDFPKLQISHDMEAN